MLSCADKGEPLNCNHLSEATATVIESVPFREGRPGILWIHIFYARHIRACRYAVPTIQERKRFIVVNTENLTMHFATLHALEEKCKLTSNRAWNFDETGVSTGRDGPGKIRERRFIRRTGGSDYCTTQFSHESRITI